MAQMAIGYNISEAKNLLDEIKQAYTNIETQITSNWSTLITSIQKEWVGEDEQAFETNLASRISNLYVNSAQLVDNCGTTISNLAQAWYTFQQKNVLVASETAAGGVAGTAAGGVGKTVIEYVKPQPKANIVSKKEIEFSESTNRGLASETSATTIKTAVSTYIKGVRDAVNGLFEKIKSSKAFFGTQTASIELYIQQLSTTVQEVVTAVKDMYNQVDKVAGTTYTTTDTEIQGFADSEKTTLETTVNQDLGASRWI